MAKDRSISIESSISIDDTMLQRVRLAHCSYEGDDSAHFKCVGSILISRHGVLLLCNLCGSDKPTICIIQSCNHEAESEC